MARLQRMSNCTQVKKNQVQVIIEHMLPVLAKMVKLSSEQIYE